MADPEQRDLTMLTVELLSAYVARNEIRSEDLAALIKSTHGALAEIDAPAAPKVEEPEYPPAVTIRKSLASRDHLLSMIDGKPYKTLKRHASRHGLTPAEYRQRYNLPADYPMVAPAYSEHRRTVAQQLGLGRKAPTETEQGGEASAEAASGMPQDEPSTETVPADAAPAGTDAPTTGRDRRKPAAKTEAPQKAKPAAQKPRGGVKAAEPAASDEGKPMDKVARGHRRAKRASAADTGETAE